MRQKRDLMKLKAENANPHGLMAVFRGRFLTNGE
jgi:hypothetical protein